MGDKMISFFKIIKNSQKNHNLYIYYFNKWAETCGELGQAQRDLTDAKLEIKELKDKLIELTHQKESFREQLEPFRKHQFKKGRIPWNKGKKFTIKEVEETE